MLRLYRWLMAFYPAVHRDQFGEEMAGVFGEMQSEIANERPMARAAFCIRETAGLLAGVLREHFRALSRAPIWLPFPRRFTMRTQFRFPKATAVLMTIILAGVVLAIERGEAIVASLAGPMAPAHFTFLPTVALLLVIFYSAGLIGWAILFALHRSGVHRLNNMSADQK